MSALITVTLVCDVFGPDCQNRKPAGSPTGDKVAAARRAAREAGWAVRREGVGDVCPSCWSRRVTYRAGRPVGA